MKITVQRLRTLCMVGVAANVVVWSLGLIVRYVLPPLHDLEISPSPSPSAIEVEASEVWRQPAAPVDDGKPAEAPRDAPESIDEADPDPEAREPEVPAEQPVEPDPESPVGAWSDPA